MSERIHGVVWGWDRVKLYGFIRSDNGGASLFVGSHALKASGIDSLVKGDVVTFRIATARNGKPECIALELVTPAAGEIAASRRRRRTPA